MSLTIETGEVIEGADSYISLDDARTYAINYNLTISDDDTIAEGQLRSAYLWLIDTYESNMQGYRTSGEQTGCFPRTDVYARGYAVGSNSIPQDVINAQVNMAASIQSGVDTNATQTGSDLASFNVDGVYSETYKDGSTSYVLAYTPAISRMLRPYMNNGGRIKCDRDNMRLVNGW